jgi:hypothetical protein
VCGRTARTDLRGRRDVTRVSILEPAFAAAHESAVGRWCCKSRRCRSITQHSFRRDRTLNLSVVKLRANESILRVSASKKLLQHYRHIPELPSVVNDGRLRCQGGLSQAGPGRVYEFTPQLTSEFCQQQSVGNLWPSLACFLKLSKSRPRARSVTMSIISTRNSSPSRSSSK